MPKLPSPLFALALFGLSSACANVVLPPLISDNLVLQSSHAAVWGTADPGEQVNVVLGNVTAKATADAEGKWRVLLEGLKPGDSGTMSVSGKNKLLVQNVAVGDVWVCSGQSNMEMMVTTNHGGFRGVLNFEKEIAEADHPRLRMFTVTKKSSETPVAEVSGKWEVCTPQTVPNWSATGYFFGRQLQQDLGIPVGLIHASWGGTAAQAWTPAATLQGDPVLKDYHDARQAELANLPALKEKFEKSPLAAWRAAADAAKAEGKPVPPKPRGPLGAGEGGTASALYNGMIAGVTQFPIKGVIWYQGEANTRDAVRYRRLLPAMITAWRQAWNQGDFPFHIVQIASFMASRPEPADSIWADLRDAQRTTVEQLPQTGLAVAIDIGDSDTVHPANKQEVGRRLALVAEARTYGKPVVSSGPWFESATFETAQVNIQFKADTAVGLATNDGQPVHGFALAGADRKFVWAEAKIVPGNASKNGALVLSAPGVQKPIAVRYAWANYPSVNLVNTAGLPAVPFRTDDWPQVEPPAPGATPAPAAKPAAQAPANGGANLALNKKYECSDPNLHGWEKGLTDGSWEENAAHTFATDLSPAFPKTITIDLEQPAGIDTVIAGVPAFGATKTIAVSVSLDGTDFKEVGSHVFGQNKTENYTCRFPVVRARYVRLTYPDHYDASERYGIHHVFTTEVEIYGPGK